jgi:hypothetical protein
MPKIGRSVGQDGQNDIADVALVQVMLRILKNNRGRPFFAFAASGHCDESTKVAIRAFQNERGLATAPGANAARAVGNLKAKTPAAQAARGFVQGMINAVGNVATLVAPADKLGLVEPTSATFRTLVQEVVSVDSDYDDLRVLPGTKMAYLASSSQDLDDKIDEIKKSKRQGRHGPVGPEGSGLEPGFRDTVIDLIKKVFDKHQIALGAWGVFSFSRDFDGQLSRVETGSSQAGPGVGNHNFGRAMDIGYKGLRWIKENGSIATIQNEDDFDKHLGWRIQALYEARNAILESPPRGSGSLFRIRMKHGDNDPNHFQAVNQLSDWYPHDKVVSMIDSLAGLLTKVGPKFDLKPLQQLGLKVTAAMTWEAVGDHLECDLGFGGGTVPVGSPTEIFKGHAHVTAHNLVVLTNLAAAAGTPHIHNHDISTAQVNAMKQALKQIMDLADDNWRDWKALDSQGNPI